MFYRFIAIVNAPLQLMSIKTRKMILYLDQVTCQITEDKLWVYVLHALPYTQRT